ncbi:hypothetical protein KBC03_07820 [Patescibacteria group bacterium]|nr:hypothetical protein [Patescibacteria group bacterium]
MKKRQIAYLPRFIWEIPDGLPYFIACISIYTNQTKTMLFIDPYGFAIEDQTEIFLVRIIKDSEEYSVNKEMAIPYKVVTTCPKGWIKINIQALPIEQHPEYDSGQQEDEFENKSATLGGDEDIDFRNEWANYTPVESFEAMVTIIAAMVRKKVSNIPDITLIQEMKFFIYEKLQGNGKYTLIESALWSIDDELLATRLNEECKELLREIRVVADNRLITLLAPQGITAGREKDELLLSEISLGDLKDRINEFAKEKLTDYLSELTEKDMNEDDTLKKATFIRDYLKNK